MDAPLVSHDIDTSADSTRVPDPGAIVGFLATLSTLKVSVAVAGDGVYVPAFAAMARTFTMPGPNTTGDEVNSSDAVVGTEPSMV